MNSVDEEVQMKLLRIDSSARTASVTRQLTARAAEEWKENNPDGDVIHRDLSAIQIPPITDVWSATLLERGVGCVADLAVEDCPMAASSTRESTRIPGRRDPTRLLAGLSSLSDDWI
jgi:Flavodoxin-like fold